MVFAAFRELFGRRGRRSRACPVKRPLPSRVALERLEDRLAPALVEWVCGTGNWNTPSCWSNNQLPTAADDVTIDRPGSITVTNNLATTTIRSLRNADTLELVGTVAAPAAFTAGAAIQNDANAVLRLRRSSLGGGGSLTNAGTVEATGVSRIDVAFGNAAGGTLRALATNQFGGANSLTLATGFTNNGTIEITSAGVRAFTSTLSIDSGTLTNAAGGVISSLVGSGGGRNLIATVTNLGRITANQTLNVDIALRTFTTSAGTLEVAAGRTLNLKARVNDLGVVLFGSGTVLQGAGTVELGDRVNLQLVSDFTVRPNTPTLSFGGDVSVTGAGRFINRGTFRMTSRADLDAGRIDSFSVDVINEGTFHALGVGNEILGTFTSGNDSMLKVEATRTHLAANLTVANGFTNNGTIELTADLSDAGARLNVLAGTLLNPSGRTIVATNLGSGSRTLDASLDNRGTLRLERELTIENANHTFTLTGEVLFLPNVHLNLVGGDSVFGEGNVLSGQNTSRLNLRGMHTMTLVSAAFFLQSGGPQLKLVGNVTINGPGTLISGIPLELTGDIINAPLENQNEVIAWGAGNQINGSYQATGGSGIRIEGRDPCDAEYGPGSCGNAELMIGQSFTNNGPFRLTSRDNFYFAMLAMPAGTTFTNNGTLTAEFGEPLIGGDRFIYAEVNNLSLIRIESPLLQVGAAGANHVNAAAGVINATMGSLLVTGAASFHNLGTLDIGNSQAAVLTEGSLVNFNAGTGTLTGGVFKITEGLFQFPDANIVTNLADIQLTGAGALICDVNLATCDATMHALLNFAVNARVNPTVFGNFQISNRTFDITADFTNEGKLTVGSGATFTVVSGDLTNFSGGTLRGQGVYDIRGTFRFRGAAIVTNGDAGIANSPTIILTSAASAIQDENGTDALRTTFIRNNGTVVVEGGRDLITDSFTNAGLIQLNTNGQLTSSIAFEQISGARLILQNGRFVANTNVTFTNRNGARIEGEANSATSFIQCENLQNEGTLAPGFGNTLGRLTLKGNYTQTPQGTLEITMTGNQQSDHFAVVEITAGDGSGLANLGGGVVMQPVTPPYTPTAGHFFDVLSAVAYGGTFSSVTGAGGPYTADYADPAFVRIRR